MANYVRALSQNVENAHVHFSIYNKWKSIKDLPSIAVVRDPVDKFLSGSFFLTQNFNPSSWDNWRSFQTMLPACMSMHANNWWLPQHEFVSSNTKIWKYWFWLSFKAKMDESEGDFREVAFFVFPKSQKTAVKHVTFSLFARPRNLHFLPPLPTHLAISAFPGSGISKKAKTIRGVAKAEGPAPTIAKSCKWIMF